MTGGVQAVLEFAEAQLSLIERERNRIESVKRELQNLLNLDTSPTVIGKAATATVTSTYGANDVFRKRNGNDPRVTYDVLPKTCEGRAKETRKNCEIDAGFRNCCNGGNNNLTTSSKDTQLTLMERQQERAKYMKNELASLLNVDNAFANGPKEIFRGKRTFPADPGNLGNKMSQQISPAEFRREAAAKYKQELEKQIEDKKRREAEERKLQDIEDQKMELKIERQRENMLEEYYREQERLRRRTDELIKRQELVKASQPSSPVKSRHHQLMNSQPPRSPSYLHVKLAKAPPIPSNFRQTSSVRPLEDRLRRHTMSVPPPSESHRSPEFAETLQVPLPTDATHQTQYDRPNNPSPPSTQESFDHQHPQGISQIESNDRILARLADVRKKMQEDHMNMLKQLRIADSELE